jgi:hypothetical protein
MSYHATFFWLNAYSVLLGATYLALQDAKHVPMSTWVIILLNVLSTLIAVPFLVREESKDTFPITYNFGNNFSCSTFSNYGRKKGFFPYKLG